MSTMLDWNLWRPSFVTVALGATFVFLAALMVQRWVQSMTWRRTLWQIAFLSVGLLALVELSGTGRLALNWFWKPVLVPDDATTLVEAKVIGEPDPQLLAAAHSHKANLTTSESNNTLAKPASLWWPTALCLGGVGVVLSWMIVLRLSFWLLVRRRVVGDETLLARVDAIARRLGLSQRMRVTEVRVLVAPIAYGIIRPGISLPEGFASGHSIEQQDVMLAHELAHLAARDPLWHTLADIVMSLVWWHPLAWLARHELHSATEAAADEACLVVENGPTTLAECLVDLGSRLSRRRSLGWLGIVGGGFRSALGKRVNRLLSTENKTWNPPSAHRVALIRMAAPLALAALILATTVWAQPTAIGPATFRDAFQQSVLGIMLTAALPTPQLATEITNQIAEILPPPTPPATTHTSPRQTQTNRTNNGQQTPTQLHTRFFKIDLETFERALLAAAKTDLDSAISNAVKISRAIDIPPGSYTPLTAPRMAPALTRSEMLLIDTRRYFAQLGVDFSAPGRQLVYNDTRGQLMTRATLEELYIIEHAIGDLTTPPPQVVIEASVYEVTKEDAKALGLDWFLGNEFTNLFQSTRQLDLGNLWSLFTPTRRQTTNYIQATGILTEAQRRVFREAMDRRGLTNLLNAPKMTMLSGRQGQFKQVRVRYIVTDMDWSSPITSSTNPPQGQPIAEQFELGPVLDVVPYVQADGKTIELTTIPTVTEFEGYDLDSPDRRKIVTMPDGRKEIVLVPDRPLPIFRNRQIVSRATVKDGHTLVLAGGSSHFYANPIRGQALQPGTKVPTNAAPTHLLIFVTPTLIDPAGNRINPPEDIPPGAPAQPPAPGK